MNTKFNQFNENNSSIEEDWIEAQQSLDVYQMMEILIFKYGRKISEDLMKEINDYDEDYNPDHFYEQIRYALEQANIFEDFVENHEQYSIEKDENDPSHWRYRKKHYTLSDKW